MFNLCAALLLAFAIPASASAAIISVGSIANIFGAGQASLPGGAGGGAGIFPPHYDIAPGPAQTLQFTNVGGKVGSVFGGQNLLLDPDGQDSMGLSTNMGSQQGLSGIKANGVLFLIGVFLGDAAPSGTPPATLDFTSNGIGTDFLTLAPQIGQLFYIGDGRTGVGGVGVQQVFHIPETATRIFFGVADGQFDGATIYGEPGSYNGNVGGFGLTFEVVPEPASGLLSLVASSAVVMLASWQRRRLVPKV